MLMLFPQLCPTLRPHRRPGSSVHGISQARILERIAIPFSKGTFQPRDRTLVSCITGKILYCLSYREVVPMVVNI